MKVDDETLYVAEFPTEDHVFATREEAIDALRENGDDVDPENGDVSIVEVDFSDDDWAVMELAWQEIALSLLQD
jgi:hypothetical protein